MTYFQYLLNVFLFLFYRAHGKQFEEFQNDIRKKRFRFVFYKVTADGVTMHGEIKMTKIEFGKKVRFVAEARDANDQPAKIEEGSAEWELQAQDAEGDDASGDYDLKVSDDNPLEATLQHREGVTRESTALVTLRADGDTDSDETQPIVGTASVIVDSPNAIAFAISATAE